MNFGNDGGIARFGGSGGVVGAGKRGSVSQRAESLSTIGV